ncbi:glucose 1-dehydrogenase [Cellvibrio fibrivorans]|uniref:NAD(P)-dependent dehydrogenase (Short-subunit alcohol dehydrogenase family) n=1 Tax=Cellvibrio fibrivorans TaxID=126350 RepID=A0ABU1UV02_9GAMM|nr:glucose 1-dehydrogenase [Cellvibrio fibrivorans]MDR7088990.1 NAD(P)-dependent dehydrogenase (short-subunit alcohol dehydrogenase family) [Cellvibrio fibrivorans]
MSNPVMLITGASSGIGAATALLAAERGYDLVITYLTKRAQAETIAQKIIALGRNALCVQADVGIESDVLNLFSQIDNTFGRLDVLVNNAAILRQKLFRDTQVAELEKLFAVNVIGSFICAREAIKRMSKLEGGNGGAIVNVSSIAARFGSPLEYIDYAASKGAIDTFTMGLAKELVAEGIRVNCVRPGIINTELHAKGGEPGRIDRIAPTIPMQRAGEADEVANAILWLASDEASYITGSLLDVSGGR